MENEAPDRTQPTRRGRRPARLPLPRPQLLLTAGAIALAAVLLAACGSSGTSTTTTNSASANTGTGAGAGGSRFSALRACLQKQGINLPPRSAQPGRPPSGGFGGRPPGGGFKLPAGVSRAQFEAALKKCGGGGRFGFRRGGGAALKNPTVVAALTKYSQCMRANGVNLPAPNTSGNGPVFNTSGIDTSSPAFAAAQQKCRSDLPSFFGRGGAPPGPGPSA